MELTDLTMRGVVGRMEAAWPGEIAIATPERNWTFGDLARDCRRAARALLAKGIGRGDRIAIWAPNSAEWVIAVVGAQLLGAAVVPLNTRYKGAEAAFILGKSKSRLVFTVSGFLGVDYPGLLTAQDLPHLEAVVRLDGSGWTGFLDGGTSVSDQALDAAIAAVTPDDISDILFTSGTTGEPKGVLSRQAPSILLAQRWGEPVSLGTGDRYLVVNPFFHSFGYKAGWLACLVAGARILPMPVFDAGEVLRCIAREKVSVLPGPPALFQSMLVDPALAETDLSSLRASVTGAASVPPSLIRRMKSELCFDMVLTAYGLTEAPVVSMSPPDDTPEIIASTCGVAIAGVEIRIADDDGRSVPEGETGEVLVRGFDVMDGYLDDPAATAEAIDADGWLHTGDIGTLTDNRLRITDRKKEMYISGGFNCYPAEIERMMAAHPAIAQVAVIGVPDERMGEIGRAFVVARPGAERDAAGLLAWCREEMANYKAPRTIAFVESLPMTASGKVQRHLLRTLPA
ncbi:FadD3 family acyl-CoA ligase [Sphingomonas sp. G-3-2-10]|uniref:FadD3 family acyl-CoA ligase n=1 Tax=Sphingomonas sp. G-3-2-10 TaxID=2728838 RepID=UPI00146CC87B|nr:AMP-binding protein [Sphingomonas sp. G-3-2-10]